MSTRDDRTFDVAVVGGGAAGHTAAIAAMKANPSARVVLLEASERVGRKLLATGNGRCNLSHEPLDPDGFHGADPAFARDLLPAYGVEWVKAFFADLGIYCRTEPDGRVFPQGLQAVAVQDALRMACARLGVTTRCSSTVQRIRVRQPLLLENTPLYQPYAFALDIESDAAPIRAETVIVACGSPAAPQLGGQDSGYALLKELGHTVRPPRPVISQITTVKEPARRLSGIHFDGTATLYSNGRPVRREEGEILFAQYGLSGPPILQLAGDASRILDEQKNPDLAVGLDFLPDWSDEKLRASLIGRAERLRGITGLDFLSGYVNKRIGQYLVTAALDMRPGSPIGPLSEKAVAALARALKDTRIRVTGVRGWKNAQAAAGGADTRAFHPGTMESRIVPGLYACGEVLDIDGDCGGYNLHWAWISGWLAGSAASGSVSDAGRTTAGM